jgi:uncharacterized protein with LGFP repeats
VDFALAGRVGDSGMASVNRIRFWRAFLALTLSGAVVATSFVGGGQAATAANPGDFRAGEIISDTIFFDSTTMTESQIEAFLNAKVPACREAAACLKSYTETTWTRPADPMCSTYQGAPNESAARIIWKVAQACDINPQVLLVTLQKEQGLITSTLPSARMYRSAMGYGCPDTAPCDAEYYGFFNQVYKGAWAFQRYTMPAGTGPGTPYYSVYSQYAAGKTASVLYHPNSACGSSNVFIKNKATGSLYFYTPYQPNAAALNAGYGLGNSCSAYGNRNFFNYFTDWFGSTFRYGMTDAVEARWKANGAGGGSLGEPTGAAVRYTGAGGPGWVQKFEDGAIYHGDTTGAYAVFGEMRAEYVAQGSRNGILGWPRGDREQSAASGGGFSQKFQHGVIYASAAGAFAVTGEIRKAYLAAGSKSGSLGWPTGHARHLPDAGGGFVQSFQHGDIYQGGSAPAFAVVGDFRAEYQAQNTVLGVLGWPRGNVADYVGGSGGRAQKFQNGAIYGSPTGVFTVAGDLRRQYLARGSKGGALGWPTGNAVAAQEAGGGLVQQFQGGTLYDGSATAAVAVTGVVRDRYLLLDAQAGALGWPRANVDAFTSNGGGAVQKFQNGAIYSSRYGAFAVVGHLRPPYLAAGSRNGVLGWPREDAVRYADSGGGLIQRFQGGGIYAGDGVGAFAVTGSVRKLYIGAGSRAGVLGWPTGPAASAGSGDGIVQPFQGGGIYAGPASVNMVTGAVHSAYAAAGSTSGVLGWPRENATQSSANGGGQSQRFAGGAIYSSAAGAYPVTGAIRVKYLQEGSKDGRLGWPTSVAVETSVGSMEQTFQRGSIRWSKTGGAVVTVTP